MYTRKKNPAIYPIKSILTTNFTNLHEYTSSCDAEDTHQIGDYSRLYKRLKTLVFIRVIRG